MSKKVCSGFFKFCLDLELLRNFFANNSRSKQNEKTPTDPFVYIGKKETCAKFQQKILNCRVVGAHQSFQIFRQNASFLVNNKALSKFLRGILHYLICISNYNKISP